MWLARLFLPQYAFFLITPFCPVLYFLPSVLECWGKLCGTASIVPEWVARVVAKGRVPSSRVKLEQGYG
jgi:hypothetical protein